MWLLCGMLLFKRIVRSVAGCRSRRPAAAVLGVVLAATAAAAWSLTAGHARGHLWRVSVATGDYTARAAASARLLARTFYNGTGLWHMCAGMPCSTKNRDWGADSLTYVLWFRWTLTRDPAIPPIMATLAGTAHEWRPGEVGSSDTVLWDAIAE